MSTALIWTISALAIAGVLFRPKNWSEAVWACLGAAALVISGLLPLAAAGAAVAKGTDVYLFLTGMMLLAELARREGVFDWLAGLAVEASGGSRSRLFALVYAVGTAVTVFLSNDATAVVLTPAVYAAVKRARVDALTYLFICAFIANAASFVLPISNPANLVVYGKSLPPLAPWLRAFFLPSVCSIGVTYAVLRWMLRGRLEGNMERVTSRVTLSRDGKRAAFGIATTGAVLMTASAMGFALGLPTCAAALMATAVATRLRGSAIRELVAGVSWSVLPLVTGLFVLVEAMNRAGALQAALRLFHGFAAMPPLAGELAAAFSVAGVSNLMNNLPSGLLAGSALQALPDAVRIRDAVLIGVDLGPNLSVTGSLATILWLVALRREGIEMGAWRFLKLGAIAMPPALLAATLALNFR
jgi:arsenical pump membrane protein